MKLITFVNNGVRRLEMRIGNYLFVVSPGQTVTLEERDADFARALGLEVAS